MLKRCLWFCGIWTLCASLSESGPVDLEFDLRKVLTTLYCSNTLSGRFLFYYAHMGSSVTNTLVM